jgi:hypothetical protein
LRREVRDPVALGDQGGDSLNLHPGLSTFAVLRLAGQRDYFPAGGPA